MNAKIKLLLVALMLVSTISVGNAAERKMKILVLHSYHQGLEWTDNITSGIQQVFAPLHDAYEVHYEYLDTKRNTGKAYMHEVARFVSEKNSRIRFEAIIASDNNALELLNEGALTFKGDPPIIFCGINNYNETLTSHLNRVTGIAETTNHRGTLDLMMKLHPQRKHVYIVLDRTPTGNSIREEFKRFEEIYAGKLEFEFLRDFILDELPDKLAHLDGNDIIYILTFNRDRNNNFISYSEGIEMLSRSANAPIYGSWDFYLGKGIVGGSITSGYQQGLKAANIAVKMLQGYQEIPVLKESPVRYMFDYIQLQKQGIDGAQLPVGSTIINMPPAPYERYKSFLILISATLLLSLLWLLWKYLRQRSVLEEKKAQAIRLELMVQERTRELEESNEKLQLLSSLDGLTQLHNRRYFDERLDKEVSRLQRLSSPISLLICDIDYFKKYNDSYGHLAGDDCIKIVANTIQQSCKRAADVAARYGGEEFAVILPDSDSEHALRVAESICSKLESRHLAHEASDVKDIVTLSIGVASIVPDQHTTPSSLISIADRALYESKHNGRDRITVRHEAS